MESHIYTPACNVEAREYAIVFVVDGDEVQNGAVKYPKYIDVCVGVTMSHVSDKPLCTWQVDVDGYF